MTPPQESRPLTLWGATGVGVGAIVGGGVLALAGVAFATTGPSAILAFALNGVVALLTVLSFSELASRFPESGGTYTYARKVLSVDAAFGIGWVVWFASVVAAVLYALGFAVFFHPFLEGILALVGVEAPAWLGGRFALLIYALGAVGYYSWALLGSADGGGQWPTVGKVALFLFVIGGGVLALLLEAPAPGDLAARFRPFLAEGGSGLLLAMGYTFIALQGFDLIAAVGGEVQEPEKNIPRAMLMSLAVAMAIYLPLLVLVVAVGTGGVPVVHMARAAPETLIATAAGYFLGPMGYWLIIVAGVLSMVSALQANLLAASRFASTMARDRTLPRNLAKRAPDTGSPVAAVKLTGVMVAFLLLAVPNVAAAGAVAGLIFLVSFALVHGIAYLARTRSSAPSPFRTLAFPAVQAVGGAACLGLGLFQAIAIPSAGVLAALWIAMGAALYAARFGQAARIADAGSEARDPELLRLRGRTRRILVPIANPASAVSLMAMVSLMAPRGLTRVLLLSVIKSPKEWPEEGPPQELVDAQAVLGGALGAAMTRDLQPEAMVTIHDDPWIEIARVARQERCSGLFLGFGRVDPDDLAGPLERLIGRVDSNVLILRAPPGWDMAEARRILVPSGGGRYQSPLRARLLGNLCRTGGREVTFLRVLPDTTLPRDLQAARRDLEIQAADEAPLGNRTEVVATGDLLQEVGLRAQSTDLVILGLQPATRTHRFFGERVLQLVENTTCPLLMINQKA